MKWRSRQAAANEEGNFTVQSRSRGKLARVGSGCPSIVAGGSSEKQNQNGDREAAGAGAVAEKDLKMWASE